MHWLRRAFLFKRGSGQYPGKSACQAASARPPNDWAHLCPGPCLPYKTNDAGAQSRESLKSWNWLCWSLLVVHWMVIGSHARPRFDFARESCVIFSSELRKMRLQQGQHQRMESRLLLETPIAMTRDPNFTLQKRFKHSDSLLQEALAPSYLQYHVVSTGRLKHQGLTITRQWKMKELDNDGKPLPPKSSP